MRRVRTAGPTAARLLLSANAAAASRPAWLGRSLPWLTGRGFADGKPRVKVVFGSQTGTAQGFAAQLRRDARKRGIEVEVIDMAKAELSVAALSNADLCVLISSCFGVGEPPDNAKPFVQWLSDTEREAEKDEFQKIKYAVFGLGQSKHYPQRYQSVGKLLDAQLSHLGAQRVLKRGEGDDSGDIEGDFDEWEESLFARISKLDEVDGTSAEDAPADATVAPVSAAPVAPSVTDKDVVLAAEQVIACSNTLPQQWTVQRPYRATLKASTELHSSSSVRSCKHLEFDISGSGIQYFAGDYLGVYAPNDRAQVRHLLDVLRASGTELVDVPYHPALPLDAATQAAIQSGDRDVSSETFRVSLREALIHTLDTTSSLRRAVLRGLAQHTTDPEERRHLELLGGRDDLAADAHRLWISQERRAISDVLAAFPSLRLTPQQLVDQLPPLQNRFYSISSSPEVNPDSIHLTVVRAQHTAKATNQPGFGVCSQLLTNAFVGLEVPVFVKHSLFRLPKDPSLPIVMVGAGTGVAPFRGFLQERLSSPEGGDNMLVFGCDNSSRDWIYKDEMLGWKREFGDRMLLFPTFAMEHPYYEFVQYRMLHPECAPKIWQLLNEQGGHFYICGAQVMGNAVFKALRLIAEREGNLSRPDAEALLSQWQADGRYSEDVY